MKSKARPSIPLSRPPLERMQRIHQALLTGKFPNTVTLARELEVSAKSVQRDIEFMRDRLNLPVEYNPSKFGYYYTEDVGAFPTVQITEGELFALLVAEKALQQYRGTNFEKPLLSAIKKMESSLPDTISFNLAEIDQSISFRTSAEPILDLEIFSTLGKAVTHRNQMEITYRKPGSPQTETRLVDPYHLANINGEWFLFAFDHLRKDVRTFAPGRISAVRKTGETFVRPAKFSPAKMLRDSFGVHSGKEVYTVVIRFDAFAADYIREKRWHASQELKELPKGGLELSLKLSSLGEVQRWILGWAGHAKVVQPPELVAGVKQAAMAILGQDAS